jgi:hypothetical protein
MKRIVGIALIALILIATAYALLRPRGQKLDEAYIGERTAKAWSSLAQVRQPVATLHFGDLVNVVQRRGDEVQIRLPGGALAWLEARVLMDPALWQRGEKLLADTKKMPLQASGRTKVLTNVRVEPGRNAPRIFQLGRDATVEIFGHAWAETAGAEDLVGRDSGDDEKPKREDWFLIRGHAPASPADRSGGNDATTEGSSTDVAGWVIARFIELDLPDTIKDYASSSGLRVLAWFELNSVPEAPGSDVQKPQYLVAGRRGGDGQACDFTMLRVYTWGAARRRYETAFVEGNLCGAMPIRVGKAPTGEPEFRFREGDGGKAERVYRMKQTSVRRVRETAEAPARRRK